MKNICHRARLFAALLCLFGATGCNTVSVSSFQYVGSPVFAPTDPAQVQILRTPPTRPHERLGEITAQPATDGVSAQKIQQALQAAAARLGADAVVIVSDSTQVTGAVVTGPWYGRTVMQTTGRVVVGVAIRYTGK